MFSFGTGMLQSNKCTGTVQSNMWEIDVLNSPWNSPYGHIDSLKGTIVTSMSSSNHNCCLLLERLSCAVFCLFVLWHSLESVSIE